MIRFNTSLVASISTAVVATGLLAGPAAAQVVPVSAEASAAGGVTADGIDEIVVTARKRSENLLTTPVSATVLSRQDLVQQNVRNFQDLRGAVSNLEVIPLESGSTSFTVRGIGQTADQVNSDTKAGLYVDEMYVSRQEGNDLYFYDIASLQVLKGPQGTLFGKNTTAGAILLTTQRPTSELGGYAQIRGGSFHRIDTEGALNLPLADGIYGRASFRTQNADGFINHLLDNKRSGDIDNRSVRLQLRVEQGPLTADLLGEYNQSRTDGGSSIPIACDNNAGYIQNYNALHKVAYCDAYPVLGKKYQVYGGATLSAPTSSLITDLAQGGDANGTGKARYVGQGPYNHTRVYTANGRLNYQLSDSVALHSVTAYRNSRAQYYTPRDNTPNDIYAENDDTRTKQFTQELTLGGTALDNRLTFLGGLFYYNQKTTFLQDTGPDWIDPLGYIYDGSLKYESYAAFAQASFKITPKLELTVGGRYTHDRKTGGSYVFFAEDTSKTFVGTLPGTTTSQTLQCGWFVNSFLGGVTNCAGPAFTARDSHSWHGFDPKVQLSYRWSDSVFTYVSAAHGYNAGGFNQQLGSQPADGRFVSYYNPEKLWSYEGGIKTELFDRRVVLNLSAFYQKYSDIQSSVNILIGGVSTRQVQSAASAHEKGFEGEFILRPTRDLTLRGNASYLSQGYDKIYPGAVDLTLDTPINSAPKYTYSAAIDYDVHVGSSGIVTPSVDVRGISSKWACPAGASYTCKLPAYALVGFRVDYVPRAGSPWKLGIYGTNIFDKFTQLARTGFFGGFGIDRYTPGRPQEFGAEISWKF
ncbi:TonB-dependent receptor [Sphingomonas sp. ASY06-1R]|uniref:TonB-dependent receptor n=1 Tax=Sphingomonas sp. ASY06-1R TaxID=3445771 RepID=UPI003FA2AB4A